MTNGHLIMKSVVKTTIIALGVLVAFTTVAQDKKVQGFSVERVIPSNAESVWKVVGEDFGAIANSHPYIVSSHYVDGSLKGGEGAERQCNMNDSGTKYVKERQTNYDPENYTFDVQILHAFKIPLDADYSTATYKVVPQGNGKSKLMFTMSYRTKPAFMGAMAKGKFKKTLSDYLLAVEHHVTTGEKVTRDNFKEIKKQYKS